MSSNLEQLLNDRSTTKIILVNWVRENMNQTLLINKIFKTINLDKSNKRAHILGQRLTEIALGAIKVNIF